MPSSVAAGQLRHLLASALCAVVAVLGAELTGRSLFFGRSPPVVGLAVIVSLVGGLCLAALTVWLTARFLPTARGRQWLEEMGPGIAGNSSSASVLVASIAAASEELFFRGWLLPLTGLALSSLLFGAAHTLAGGRARWTWAAAATLFAVALGLLTQLTGSLVGALVAHVLVNAINLRRVEAAYFRFGPRRDAPGRRSGGRPLGGLLRTRT